MSPLPVSACQPGPLFHARLRGLQRPHPHYRLPVVTGRSTVAPAIAACRYTVVAAEKNCETRRVS